MTLPIPSKALSQHIALLGKTRSGKSTIMRDLAEWLLDNGRPVCIVDPKGDWWGLKSSADGKKAGYPVVIFGGEHADVPINEHSGAAVAELVATGNRPCIIDLGGWMPAERTRFWVAFASTLFRTTRGLRWLLVDEIHNFAPKGRMMDIDAAKALHWTNRLASEGLGKGIHMVFASQRPQKVHNDVLTSAETLIALRVLHPSDREAVSEWIKGCGDPRLGAEVMASLADLGRGEGWVWSPEIGFGPKRIQFPMYSTYDSFRPATAGEAAEKLKGWATVDLEDVKAKLAAAVEEAKANDPVELRRQIADQKREISRLSSSLVSASDAAAPNNAAVTADIEVAARAAGAAQGYDAGYKAGQLVGRVEGRATGAEQTKVLLAPLDQLLKDIQARIERATDPAYLEAAKREGPQRPTAVEPPKRSTFSHPAKLKFGEIPDHQPVLIAKGDRSISRPQQKILDGLAWLRIFGVDEAHRSPAAMLGNQSPKSSGFERNVSTLKTAGLVFFPSKGTLGLTEAGIAAARAPDMPPTDSALHDMIRRQVSGPQWLMLDALIKAYPRDLTHAELAEASDQSPKSSGFERNRSVLKSLGFLCYPKDGHNAATDILFIERARR